MTFVVGLSLTTDFSSFFVIVLSENSIFIEDDGVIGIWTAAAFVGTVPNDATKINPIILFLCYRHLPSLSVVIDDSFVLLSVVELDVELS